MRLSHSVYGCFVALLQDDGKHRESGVLCVRMLIIRGFTAETARYAGKAGKQALFARSLRTYIDYSHFLLSKEAILQINFHPIKKQLNILKQQLI